MDRNKSCRSLVLLPGWIGLSRLDVVEASLKSHMQTSSPLRGAVVPDCLVRTACNNICANVMSHVSVASDCIHIGYVGTILVLACQ